MSGSVLSARNKKEIKYNASPQELWTKQRNNKKITV